MSSTSVIEDVSITLQAIPPDHDTPAATNAINTVEARPAPHNVDSKGKTALIITTITGVTTISSLLSGVVVIGLPVIARDLKIPEALLFWPTSIYSLTGGCTLIICGALADVIGPRPMYLIGTFFQSVFTLACALSRTSTQFIVFRALAGVAISMCLPSAVSLIMSYFQAGRRRNMAFGAMGGGYPLGFTVGLVMGGLLTDAAGWQVAFYLGAGINGVLFVLAFVGLPKLRRESSITLDRLKQGVDWIGAIILSTSLALLLYVFATWTGNIANIKSLPSLTSLIIGVILLPLFVGWMHRQEKKGHAVLIRNSLWRKKAFTSICINVFFIWGSINATETFTAFLFQDVQGLSATSSAIRFLPEPVTGFTINILIGLFVHRLKASWWLQISFALSAVSPLLLAVMRKDASYWEYQFPAMALVPVSTDVLYTISQLIITAEFEEETQALAGSVFNTVAQLGKSVGIALSAIIANSVTTSKKTLPGSEQDKLLEGYRAAYWFTCAATVACMLVTLWGLRGLGKVGIKQE